MTLRKKLLITYIVVVMVPIILILILITINLRAANEKKMVDMMSQMNHQMADNYDSILDDAKNSCNLFYVDNQLVKALSQSSYSQESEYYIDLEYVKKISREALSLNSHLSGITFFGNSGRLFDTTGEDAAYIQTLLSLQKQDSVSPVWSVSPVYTASINRNDIRVVTLTRELLNPYDGTHVAFLHLSLSIDKIFDTFGSRFAAHDVNQFVVFQNGNIIYSSADSQNEKSFLGNLRGKVLKKPGKSAGVFYVQSGKNRYLCVSLYSSENQFYIIQYIPMNLNDRWQYSNVLMYVAAFGILGLIAVGLSILFSKQISRPITIVVEGMKEVEKGSFQAISVQRHDELGTLIAGFNSMVHKLQASIRNELASAEAERKMQMKLLQAQINPHFISNTLNLISAVAQIEKVPVISSASSSLSHMLYYNLKGSNIIHLEDEIEQVKRYMAIQKLRFPDRITEEYHVEPELMKARMPKFILQPLIENSIYHGLEKKQGLWNLRLDVIRDADMMIIRIRDNGVGIPPDRLNEIMNGLRTKSLQQTLTGDIRNLGIFNVYYRLKNFDPRSSFNIESIENVQTCVSIRMPVTEGEDHEGSDCGR